MGRLGGTFWCLPVRMAVAIVAHGQGSAFGRVRQTVVAAVALSLWFVDTWLLNVTAYVGVNAVFSIARDIATWIGALSAMAWAYAAMRRPAVLASRWCFFGTALLLPVAGALVFASIAAESAWAVTMTCGLYSAVSAPVSAYIGLAFVGMRAAPGLPQGGYLRPLALGCLLQYLWMGLLWFAPFQVQAGALLVFPLVGMLIVWPLVSELLSTIAHAGAPVDLEVTNPFSFLPLTHRLFTVITLFSVAGGFAITYGWVESHPLPFIHALLPVCVVLLPVLVGWVRSADTLYGVAYLFVLAGLVFSVMEPASGSLLQALVGAFSRVGSEVFTLVIWFMAVSIGARNVVGAVPLMLVRGAASGFGTAVGAALGNLANGLAVGSSEVGAGVLAAVAVGFAGATFFLMRRFSFDATTTETEPVTVGPAGGNAAEMVLEPASAEHRCAELVERFGLTGREAEVLGFLARGRNVAYIQEKLVLSRNTVKSYVANVYRKLGVHSHQELLDLVEKLDAPAGR